jgi:hypothetical protein
MTDRSVVVMGLPESGKTTFLAALWHLVSEDEVATKLKYVTLKAGNAEAKRQERTSVSGDKVVSMVLKTEGGAPQVVTFPDVAGEAFQQMWERRECDEVVAESLKAPGVLLFIHADKVVAPRWVVAEKILAEALEVERETTDVVDWTPGLAPTQVQLTDLLQSLQSDPLDVGPRRVAIILSAWDKAAKLELTPEKYLETKLPLLSQFLKYGLNPGWEVRIFGVSAQGGEYDDKNSLLPEAQLLREVDVPSERVRVVYADTKSHDLTEPLQWLLI